MGGSSFSSSSHTYSLPTPNSYPSPSQPSASSLYPSLLHPSLANAAAAPTTNGLYTAGRNEQVLDLPSSPLPQYRSRSLSAPMPHQHQQQQNPHFSPISYSGRSISHSSLAHFAMAPALAGAGIGAGAGAGAGAAGGAAGSGLHAHSGYIAPRPVAHHRLQFFMNSHRRRRSRPPESRITPCGMSFPSDLAKRIVSISPSICASSVIIALKYFPPRIMTFALIQMPEA